MTEDAGSRRTDPCSQISRLWIRLMLLFLKLIYLCMCPSYQLIVSHTSRQMTNLWSRPSVRQGKGVFFEHKRHQFEKSPRFLFRRIDFRNSEIVDTAAVAVLEASNLTRRIL
eukprot:Blabericola_migrator_1__13343@NODE_940_length_5959_cov_113_267312_g652_i0_p5_GENE_NODE_940_length_5959_cov_113_267312_g652_i0NODE_940_length_5959_cov_113_267312_g652_i0_p5_ORF_typecomplete_len127_score8_38_NODE_940_length_5959_cov_113_267312_g652_i047382